MQKKLKLFSLLILVASGVLFSQLVFANYEKELAELSQQIEQTILPSLSLKEQEEYRSLLLKLNSANSRLVNQELSVLIFKLTKQSVEDSGILTLIRGVRDRLFLVQYDLRKEPMRRLKARATQYFKEYFKDNFAAIKFYEKPGGIQLGRKVKITLNSGGTIDYYVKTSRGGLLSSTPLSDSTVPKPLDPKELLVYKVFELIGLTPEVHFFFGENADDFYIATKDAGFDELTHEQKTFLTYEDLSKTEETKLSCARIAKISEAWKKFSIQTSEEADEVEGDLGIIELNIIKGLSKTDIFSRIFSLEDITTNGGNIGFILETKLAEFRIIDFVIPRPGGNYRAPDIFNGFLAGNSRYLYMVSEGSGPIKYALYARQQAKRVQTAREVISELTTVIVPKNRQLNNETIDLASKYVKEIIQNRSKFLDLPLAISDLDFYVDSIKYNLRKFRKGFSLYTDDHMRRILEHFLPAAENFVVIPPVTAIFGNDRLMENASRNAFQAARAGNIVAMPIYLYGNHWVGVIFRRQADGVVQVIYNNPQGDAMEYEQFALKFVQTINVLLKK